MKLPPHIEERIEDALHGRRRRLKVRTILTAFGHQGRGKSVVEKINSELAERGILLEPPLNAEGTTLDTTVYFVASGQARLDSFRDLGEFDDEPGMMSGQYESGQPGPGSRIRPSHDGLKDFESDAGLMAEQMESADIEPEQDSGLLKPWDPALIRVEPKAFSIRNILDMLDEDEIELEPDFQRRRVWKNAQKSLLIESLLLRIPLPAFYFSASETGQLQVIDGLQRLSTIYDFVRGGRQKDKDKQFKLTNLEYLGDQLPGITFEALKDTVWGRRINTTQIQANIVDPQTPPSVKLNIFTRINRQRTPRSQQELRHAMSKPRSRPFLAELANSYLFNQATGYALQDHPRMADREVVLRFCAFEMLGSPEEYAQHGSFTELLTATTTYLDDPSTLDSRLDEIDRRFRRAMRNAITVFEDSAFRKPRDPATNRLKPLSRPLFDTWSFYLGRIDEAAADQSAHQITRAYSALFEDEFFSLSISAGTADPVKVNYRFHKVREFLASLGLIEAEKQ